MTINEFGSDTPTFDRIPEQGLRVLSILGLDEPGTRLRFSKGDFRAENILICTRDDRPFSPAPENLRRLGVSFVQGIVRSEESAPLGRGGTPDGAAFMVSVARHEDSPAWFHQQVMAELMGSPAANELVLGLESLFMAQRIRRGGWLHLV